MTAINSALYGKPVLLNPGVHRQLRVGTLEDFSITRSMHGVFLAATEIPLAALEFPVLFIRGGERDESGQPTVSPIALLGLVQNENLFIDGTRWLASYIPAFIRRYPFLTAQQRGETAQRVMIDSAWSGLSREHGEPLFEPDGQPAAALKRAIEFLERFEAEAQRTRAFCLTLNQLGLLKEMKADATLPNGTALSIAGFFAIDEDKLLKLPDAQVLELHRSGMLALMNLHLNSLKLMNRLVERKALRQHTARVATQAAVLEANRELAAQARTAQQRNTARARAAAAPAAKTTPRRSS